MGWWKEGVLLAVASSAVAVVASLAGPNGSTSPSPIERFDRASAASAPLKAQSNSSSPSPNGLPFDKWAHGLVLDRLIQNTAEPSSVAPSQPTSRSTNATHSTPAVTGAVPGGSSTVVQPTGDTPPAPASSSATALGPEVPPSVRRWESLIDRYAGENGLDPNLVAAVMMTESGGNPSATSKKGAIGLMQVVNGSYDPDTSIRDGTRILAGALKRYGGDLELSLAAYNAGAGAVDRFGGIPPYQETETYVFVVLNRYYLYSSA